MELPSKRITAHLIPFKAENGIYSFFLQKRADDAERNPGSFTIFGGGVEDGENAESAMLREMKEELGFVPQNYFYFGEYSDNYSISSYFAVEVIAGFMEKLTVGEGEYGRFFTESEVLEEKQLSENNKKIIGDLLNSIKYHE